MALAFVAPAGGIGLWKTDACLRSFFQEVKVQEPQVASLQGFASPLSPNFTPCLSLLLFNCSSAVLYMLVFASLFLSLSLSPCLSLCMYIYVRPFLAVSLLFCGVSFGRAIGSLPVEEPTDRPTGPARLRQHPASPVPVRRDCGGRQWRRWIELGPESLGRASWVGQMNVSWQETQQHNICAIKSLV